MVVHVHNLLCMVVYMCTLMHEHAEHARVKGFVMICLLTDVQACVCVCVCVCVRVRVCVWWHVVYTCMNICMRAGART